MSLSASPSALLATATSSTTPEASVAAAVAAAATAIVMLFIHSPSAIVLQRQCQRALSYGCRAAAVLCQLAGGVWTSERLRRLRQKIVFELAATALGPGGNSLILLLLWPGWLVLAMGLLVARLCTDW